jgi:AraC-like DNA-binding protein
VALRCFFESVISFFFLENHPSPALLKLKFKELILQILTERKHASLALHFFSFCKSDEVNLKLIMERNYLFNLQLEDYAKLCNRSLSSFKRDFQKIFECSPGKWLTCQRLEYARVRLVTKNESINDIAFHSGFESSSHFIRSFKQHFGLPPLQYRDKSRH